MKTEQSAVSIASNPIYTCIRLYYTYTPFVNSSLACMHTCGIVSNRRAHAEGIELNAPAYVFSIPVRAYVPAYTYILTGVLWPLSNRYILYIYPIPRGRTRERLAVIVRGARRLKFSPRIIPSPKKEEKEEDCDDVGREEHCVTGRICVMRGTCVGYSLLLVLYIGPSWRINTARRSEWDGFVISRACVCFTSR